MFSLPLLTFPPLFLLLTWGINLSWGQIDDGRSRPERSTPPLEVKRWKSATVHYSISDDFSPRETMVIEGAMRDIKDHTGVVFQTIGSDPEDYVQITRENRGCSSEIGVTGGRQYLNLDPRECINHGTVLHELLHTLGLFHEHTRPDRDEYVTIRRDLIEGNAFEANLQIQDRDPRLLEHPYDYESIMHYAEFSGGKRAIIPKRENVVIGQRERLTCWDVKKIQILYPHAIKRTNYRCTPSLFPTIVGGREVTTTLRPCPSDGGSEFRIGSGWGCPEHPNSVCWSNKEVRDENCDERNPGKDWRRCQYEFTYLLFATCYCCFLD